MTKNEFDYYHQDMKKETMNLTVRDLQSGQTLFECPIEESERAYEAAASMEEMGLEVEVIHPTLSETLSHGLGLSSEEFKNYQKSIEDEIEGHDESCQSKSCGL